MVNMVLFSQIDYAPNLDKDKTYSPSTTKTRSKIKTPIVVNGVALRKEADNLLASVPEDEFQAKTFEPKSIKI